MEKQADIFLDRGWMTNEWNTRNLNLKTGLKAAFVESDFVLETELHEKLSIS